MNEEQRRKLLDLHGAAIRAQFFFDFKDISAQSRDAAEQAFIDYVYSLGLDGAK